jgi:hypothetical protein
VVSCCAWWPLDATDVACACRRLGRAEQGAQKAADAQRCAQQGLVRRWRCGLAEGIREGRQVGADQRVADQQHVARVQRFGDHALGIYGFSQSGPQAHIDAEGQLQATVLVHDRPSVQPSGDNAHPQEG